MVCSFILPQGYQGEPGPQGNRGPKGEKVSTRETDMYENNKGSVFPDCTVLLLTREAKEAAASLGLQDTL